jgi:hypothetical protein
MSKTAKSIEGRKAGSTGQLWLRLPGLVREAQDGDWSQPGVRG